MVALLYPWVKKTIVGHSWGSLLLLQLSLQAKLLSFIAACKRGYWVKTIQSDTSASFLCQNR